MKKIVLLLFVMMNFVSYSQSLESLKTATKKMYEANYNMTYEILLDLMYPKMVELQGRDQLFEKLEATFENESYRMRFVHLNPAFTYSAFKKTDDKTVSAVLYSNASRISYEEKLSAQRINEIKTSLVNSGKYKTVRFEKERNSFFVESQSKWLAIADATTKNEWRFIDYNDSGQAELAARIVGGNILKELGL